MPRLIQIKFILTSFVIVFAKRLPVTVIPEEYKLQIITNLADEGGSFNFKGSVLIHIKCISPTANIILHSKNLRIDEQKTILRNFNDTEETLTIRGTSQDLGNDFLILTLGQSLQAGLHYEVGLHFEGALGEEKVGYYRSSYLIDDYDDDNKNWVGVTYFKPDNARRAFPCFDELTFKAKFTISLGRLAKYNSLSNMPLFKNEEMEDKPGWQWDHFQTSPPMSTNMVGFAITEFKHETKADTDFNLRIWGPDDIVSSGHPALEFSARFLNILQIELDVKYPLPKLDMVVVPNYVVPIMDCWGLIIWQERFLLQSAMALLGFNPEFMEIMADQMVRQMFGNLVTIKSWTDLWFAEGFNMYLSEVVAVNKMMGRSDLLRSQITDYTISVFGLDSLRNSQAISTVSKQSGSIGAIYDSKARKKIFLLIRMLSHFVGQANLLNATQQYLKLYEYKNAGSEELLELINTEGAPSKVNVKTVMNTWISQAGFPLITVTRNYNRGRLEVKQERFFKDNELLDSNSTRWWIPLTYTTECESDFNHTAVRKWLSPNEDSVSIKGPLSHNDWVIFNIDASAPYLVDYDERNWNILIDFLQKPFFEKIPPMNRVVLINDAASLAWVGRLDYSIFFDMLKYIARETHDHPKYAAIRRIDDLNVLLKRTPIHRQFIDYVRDILRDDFITDETANTQKADMGKKSQFMRLAQRSGFSHIVATLSLEETILCVGDAVKEYNWNEYKLFKVIPDRKYEILRTLACCENQALLKTYLDRSLNEVTSENEDVALVIAAIARNKDAFELVAEFLADNIGTIHDRIFPNVHELSMVLNEIARHIITEDEMIWLKTIVRTNRKYFQHVQDGVDEALEVAKLNVEWYYKHFRTIQAYFSDVLD